MKFMKNISGLKLLRTFLISVLVSIVVWVPVETFFLFREARLVSYFVEEDTLLFVTRMRGTLSASENLNIDDLDNNRDLFNLYQVTINDKITLIEKEIKTGAEINKAEVTYDHLPHHKRGFFRRAILRNLSANEQRFFSKEPVTSEIAVDTYKKGGTYYYKLTTTFKNHDSIYTLSLQRDLGEIFGRYMRLEIDALGQMLWCIILTSVLTSTIMVFYTAVRFRNVMVKQTQAVALSHGDAPNLAKGQGPHLAEASDAIISLGRRLDEANERSINALSDVSHFVSSHLTEIKQAIDLIRYYGLQDEEAVKSQMKRIENNSTRIREINSTIASLAKLEGSKISITPQVYELQDLLNLAVDVAKTHYPSFKIENPKEGKTKKILIQREHFLLIVEALIQNAVKYSTGDEKKIVIQSIDHEAPKSMAQFLITNWGIGVPKGEEYRIFERYYRGSNTVNAKGGVGLGLHLVYKIVKLYDGDIDVKSELEHNHTYKTTFCITFHEYMK